MVRPRCETARQPPAQADTGIPPGATAPASPRAERPCLHESASGNERCRRRCSGWINRGSNPRPVSRRAGSRGAATRWVSRSGSHAALTGLRSDARYSTEEPAKPGAERKEPGTESHTLITHTHTHEMSTTEIGKSIKRRKAG